MATAILDEETAAKVLRQVEFYFSDSNLPRDGFLKKSINESEDGLVSLALICSFARMKSNLGLEGDVKPEDVSEETVKAVAETLRKSSVLRISEDGKKVGRSTELSKLEEVIEQVDLRTIAASPLEHDVTHEEVESFFAQYGKVNSVRLPRHVGDKKFFCGSALIEFSTEEDAGNVLKQRLSYAGAELELKPKKDFDAEREKKMVEFENYRSSNRSSSNTGSDYPKGLIVAFKLKHISAEGLLEHNGVHETTEQGDVCKTQTELVSTENAPGESKQEASENVKDSAEKPLDNFEEEKGENVSEKLTEDSEEKHTEYAADENKEKSPEDAASPESKEKTAIVERPSVAINKDNKDMVLREDLKDMFQRFGTVKYVDFKMGDDSGFIRFEVPEAAQKARAAAVLVEGGLIVKNFFASLEAVTGEAEKEYWSALRGSQERHHREFKGNRGRGGRNHRGGRQFDGKRSRSRDSDSAVGRPNKAQKVAAA